MLVRQWLEENDVKEKAYYYWLRIQNPRPPKAPDGLPTAVIKYNGLTIELTNSISEVLLSHLLKEVLHA